MPIDFKIAVDTADALNNLGAFSNRLDAMVDGFTALNTVTTNFNRKGQQTSSVVKAQISDFETVTQVINRNGKVLQTTYARNEAAARAAEERAVARAARLAAAEAARFARFERDAARAADAERKLEAAAAKRAEAEANRPGAVGQFANRIGRNLVQFASFRAFSGITQGLIEGTKAAKEFQIQLSLIRTISQDQQQSFGKFGRDVRGTSDTSGFDIKDVGKAFYDTVSNQVAKGSNVAPFVKAATDLARVTGSELPDSVNLLSSAINAYGLAASDAERISAVFFRTIDEGRIVASEMGNTFGRVAVLGSNLGVPIEDLNAILAITTQKGLKTADAMTLLTNLLIKLEKPTEATAGFFKSLGVETGEQAIAMNGLIPLVNKMVAAVKAGKIDVSAFFDEIRGRKQFGIFEQSGGEIESFAAKLKDTSATLKTYKEAIAIRGESPADALNKELNKLSNIFKVDLGQAIVKNLADLVSWLGGVDNAKANLKEFGSVLADAGKGFLVFSGVVIARNILMAVSFQRLGLAAFGALKFFVPFTAAYLAFSKLFKGPAEATNIDIKNVSGTVEQIEKLRVAAERLKQSQQGVAFDPLASFKGSSKQVEQAYGTVIKLLSQATIINDRFLDSAKAKTAETADAVKIGFGTYTDIFKKNITDISKKITDANEEIKRSTKSALKYSESLDEILFKSKGQYANDDFGEQKIKLTEKRLVDLQAKKDRLFKEGTEESLAEGRIVYDELARHEEELSNLRIEQQKKQFQKYLEDNPAAAQRPGGNIFAANLDPLEVALNKLKAQRVKDEATITESKKKQIELDTKALGIAKTQEDKIQLAIKNYEKLDLFTKDGKLDERFATKEGKFDRGKFTDAFKEAETNIRAAGGPTFEQRVALEQLLVNKKKALIEEADAFERQQDLNSTKTQILNQKDVSEKKINDLKKNRDENLKLQRDLAESFGNKSFELAGFADQIRAQSGGNEKNRDRIYGRKALDAKDISTLKLAISEYNDAAADLVNNPIVKGGVSILDPVKAAKAYKIYEDTIVLFDEIAKKYRIEGGVPAFQAEGGPKIGPDAAKEAFRAQLDQLKKSGGELFSGVDYEAQQKDAFKKNVLEPVEKLKMAFPELTVGAQSFTDSANASFKNLADGGVEQLRLKLEAVQKLMAPIAPMKKAAGVSLLDGGDESGYAYAATGGVVGMFPGQPRGQDVYPIWAAKGERIIDARTSAMYAPMLDAIMQRRMPQYMADGGTVGGDTHVGDINITVNGARTNSDTARTIGQHLERQLRLNNIRLERKP